jgi:hypothetical protein
MGHWGIGHGAWGMAHWQFPLRPCAPRPLAPLLRQQGVFFWGKV